MSRLGPSFMKIWTCRSSPCSGSQNAWMLIKNVSGVSHLSNFWNFFPAQSKWFPVAIWWPWMKPGYITMTRRQSNNQRSGGMRLTPPQKFWVQNSAGKVLTSIFLDEDGIFLIDYLPKGQTISMWSITHLCWYNWRPFWRKNTSGRSPRGSCSCTTMPRLTGHLQPRRNWPTWASIVLITHPVLWIWPHLTTTCSLDWKNNWKFSIFHLTQRSLLPWRPGWTDNLLNFFFEWLAKVRATG